MDPSQEEKLGSLFNSLVALASTARLRFSQGSISSCIYSVQEIWKKAKELELGLMDLEQDGTHIDHRAEVYTDPISQEYQRPPTQMSIQEQDRASTFSYQQQGNPSLTLHQHSTTYPHDHPLHLNRGPTPPRPVPHALGFGHTSFLGPGAAKPQLTHVQPRYQSVQEAGRYREAHDTPPVQAHSGSKRPFHSDQRMYFLGDEPISSQDRNRPTVYPQHQQHQTNEMTNKLSSAISPSPENVPGQSLPSLTRRSPAATLQDPIIHPVYRPRQRSLPQVLEYRRKSCDSPYHLQSDHDGGPRSISPSLATTQQSPPRTQYSTYQSSLSQSGNTDDLRSSRYVPGHDIHHPVHHPHQQPPHLPPTFHRTRAGADRDMQDAPLFSRPQQQARIPQQAQIQHEYISGQQSKASARINTEDGQNKSGKDVGLGHTDVTDNKMSSGIVGGGGTGMIQYNSNGERRLSPGGSHSTPTTTTLLIPSGPSPPISASGALPVFSALSSTFPFSPAGNAAGQGLGLAFDAGGSGGGGRTNSGSNGHKMGRESNSGGARTQYHAPLEPEVIARLDELFFRFLQRICSDLKASDSRGEQIHQPLMAKKMQRLEASSDFRPFKFRIQAFTNAFHESLVQHGLTEDILPLRKVKVYLWKHRYISRFNEDGKKQKSKGNHVWNIEARKIPESRLADIIAVGGIGIVTSSGGVSGITTGPISSTMSPSDPPIRWEFREYTSRIAGQIIKYARVGVPYVYTPRIWDAQMSCPQAEYSSPWLPAWLKWHRGELRGIPGPEDKSCTITVVAEYMREGEKCHLELTYHLTVSDPEKEGELMDSANEEEMPMHDGDDSATVPATEGLSQGEEEDDVEMLEYSCQSDPHDSHTSGVTRGRGGHRKQRDRKAGTADKESKIKERQQSKRRKQAK